MGYGKDKTESDHKGGHSNSDRWVTHQEAKATARKQRRLESGRLAATAISELAPAAKKNDRQPAKTKLNRLKAMAEKAYGDMYESASFEDANARFRDAKEAFREAIALAEQLGLGDECDLLRKRLRHVSAVFRSQFAQ